VVLITFGLLILVAAVLGYVMYQIHQSKEQMREAIEQALTSPPKDRFELLIEMADTGVGDPAVLGSRLASDGRMEHLDDAYRLLIGPAENGDFYAQQGLYILFRRPDFDRSNLVEAYMWRLISVPCSIVLDERGNAVRYANYTPQDKQAKEDGLPGPPSELDPETYAEASKLATEWIKAHEEQNGEGFCDPLGEYP